MIKRIFTLLAVAALLTAVMCFPASAEEIQEAQVKEIIYDFDLTETELRVDSKRVRGMSLTYLPVDRELDEFYFNGGMDWNYAFDNLDYFKTPTNSVGNTHYFGNTEEYKWDGLRLGTRVMEDEKKSYPAGYWVAFTIRVPEDGTYMLSLEYQTRGDGTLAGEVYVFDYVFPDHMTIERTLDESLRLGSVDMFKRTWDFEYAYADIGEVELLAGESTVVFRAAEKDGNDASAYMYLSKLILSNKPLQEQAANVDAMISAIGTGDNSVETVRAAYDALTDGAKEYVQQLDVLLAAEAANAEKGGNWWIPVGAAIVVAGAVVTFVVIKKKKQ